MAIDMKVIEVKESNPHMHFAKNELFVFVYGVFCLFIEEDYVLSYVIYEVYGMEH